MSDRWAVADLLAAPIMDVRRNRAILAEAVGLSLSRVLTADSGPMTSGPIPAPAPTPPPGGASKPGTLPPASRAGARTAPGPRVGAASDREPAATPSRAPERLVPREAPSAPPWPPDWLRRLMACAPFAGRLDPEQRLSADLAADCRRWTLSGELRAVWSCHTAEVRIGGKLGQCWQALLLFIGVMPGSSDFVFTWDTGALWIELKTQERQTSLLNLRKDGTARAPRRTYLRNLQPDFLEWCRSLGVPHEICRSRGDWTAALRKHGRLT